MTEFFFSCKTVTVMVLLDPAWVKVILPLRTVAPGLSPTVTVEPEAEAQETLLEPE